MSSSAAAAAVETVPVSVLSTSKICRLDIGQHIKVAIIGTTNVGKSQLFNILAGHSKDRQLRHRSLVDNAFFTTVDNNFNTFEVHDDRIDVTAKAFNISGFKKLITIIDTVGIVKDSRIGNGLGLESFEAIRSCDIFCHVVRGYDDNSHTVSYDGCVDPVRDIATVNQELMMADLQVIEHKLNEIIEELDNPAKAVGKERKYEYATLLAAYELLYGNVRLEISKRDRKAGIKFFPKLCSGQPLRYGKWDEYQCLVLNKYKFYTAKDVVYLVNLSPRDYIRRSVTSKYVADVDKYINKSSMVVPFSAALEMSLLVHQINNTYDMYMEANPYHVSARQGVIDEFYRRLKLVKYYTVVSNEVRSWLIPFGTAPPLAGSIITHEHQVNFISVSVCSINDLISNKGDWDSMVFSGIAAVRNSKYTINDGDVLKFKLR